MPDWQPDWSDVSFDSAQAAAAAETCRSAARRISALAERRDTLAADAVVDWNGRFRSDFNRGMAQHRRSSQRLVGELLDQANRIDAATLRAERLQADREGDRERWQDESLAEEEEAAADEEAKAGR